MKSMFLASRERKTSAVAGSPDPATGPTIGLPAHLGRPSVTRSGGVGRPAPSVGAADCSPSDIVYSRYTNSPGFPENPVFLRLTLPIYGRRLLTSGPGGPGPR